VTPATPTEIDQIKALKQRFDGPKSGDIWKMPADPAVASKALHAFLLHLNSNLSSPGGLPLVLDGPSVLYKEMLHSVGVFGSTVCPISSNGFVVANHRYTDSVLRPPGAPPHYWAVNELLRRQELGTGARDSYAYYSTHGIDKPASWIIEALRLEVEAAEAGVWRYLHTPEMRVPVMYTRPVVRLDENGALHAERAPAVSWSDMPNMPKVFCSHGVRMAERYVMQPETITADMVTNENNMEQRRELMRLIGYERYVREGGFTLVSDAKREFGDNPPKGLVNAKLWRKVWREPSMTRSSLSNGVTIPGQNAVLVELQNSSKEPDGSYKTYFLRVPPDMTKVADAAAWTFGMSGKEYMELAAES
jgi:hypothetical protein